MVSPTDLAILAVMYVLTALGITVGFHRLLTHRSFQAPKPVEYAFAVLGSMAVQGPVISWVADHRKHHAHTDTRATRTARTSVTATGRGACSAASGTPTPAGCLDQGRADRKYAQDLYEDRGMRSSTAASPARRARPGAAGARRLR